LIHHFDAVSIDLVRLGVNREPIYLEAHFDMASKSLFVVSEILDNGFTHEIYEVFYGFDVVWNLFGVERKLGEEGIEDLQGLWI